MNLDGIDVFVKVAQVGSFSGAARVMKMPVTTVSGKVAQLEKRLGTTLIHRTTRKLNLTQAGEAFFRRCVNALEEMQAGERELAITRTEPEGLLRVTAPVDVGHTVLLPIIRDYLKSHPKVSIETILSSRRLDLVAEGVDLALRVGKLKDSNLIARKFIETQGSFWASSAYIKKMGLPKSPKDLKDHHLVRFSMMPEEFEVTNGKDRFNVKWQSRLISDDIEMAKLFVMAGDGIGLFPNFLCRGDESSGKMQKVLPQWGYGSFTVNFIYPPQRFVDPKVKSFIEWCLRPQYKLD